MLRYILQIFVMFTDICLLFMVSLGIYCGYTTEEVFNSVCFFVMALAVLYYWVNEGGFMAWKPKNIRKFLTNAKGLGL